MLVNVWLCFFFFLKGSFSAVSKIVLCLRFGTDILMSWSADVDFVFYLPPLPHVRGGLLRGDEAAERGVALPRGLVVDLRWDSRVSGQKRNE